MDVSVHRRLLSLAVEAATRSVAEGGGPFGAVVAREGQVVAVGTNRVTASNDPTAHAEVVAIREACRALGAFQLDGCDLYASAEPCPMCAGAVLWARPRAVWYAAARDDAAAAGFDDAAAAAELARPGEARRVPFRRLAVADAAAPFRAWRDCATKRPY